MNIIDYKSQIDTLTSNLVKEYNKLEKQYIEGKKSSFNDLNDINNINSSITDCLEEKIDAINSLEKQVIVLEKREIEHVSTIKDLQKQLEESLVEKEQTNKFDMLRIQSKEIVAKDKEIDRLQKLLAKYKKDPDIKLNMSVLPKNILPLDISPMSEGLQNDVSGWSPTSSPYPTNDKVDDSNEVPVPDKNSDEDLGEEEEGSDESEEEGEECDVSVIVYRKHNYYLDPDNKVYKIEEDESMGPCVGDWIKGTTGKFKLVKC